MKQYQPNPRGRYVRAHPRRHPIRPREFVKVPAYQEELDRLRAKLKLLAELQLRFQFPTEQQPEQKETNHRDPASSDG
jgi:hypothetical protein